MKGAMSNSSMTEQTSDDSSDIDVQRFPVYL
eukprot:CAMPEP_0185613918 /NCGR_PEP_ID=MMETSP0436-20130131/29294_1 /TAXON_ID=626734 ORGANISM="Favella taraikaensis, Strain Fe Narragansett Bay" /NCGR_SAMPLE_ID=MMETSP0436 /ASSEMBLY_ACC=CAM_ASM_000390 /LENGTH=30 /DNA_ID= /DNA_START= /DNA_END= /DNA_ORIENTATION=